MEKIKAKSVKPGTSETTAILLDQTPQFAARQTYDDTL